MKFFATALVAAASQATLALGTELGQSCVTGVLGKVFKRINANRSGAGSALNGRTDYEAVRYKSEVASAPPTGTNANYVGTTGAMKWEMHQNYAHTIGANGTKLLIAVVADKTRVDESYAVLTSQTTGAADPITKNDLTWAEGLALGNQAYLSEWAAAYGTADAFTSLTTLSTGSTTASRAAANGTVTGALVEAAYFFEAWSLDATDLMNFIITNDGTNHMRDALFAKASLATYKAFSAGVQVQGQGVACTISTATPTACQHALIVTVAGAYANASGVAACQPTVSYGGGVCDPTTWGGSVWEELQAARVSPKTGMKPILTAIAAGCSGLACTYDWAGTGSTTAQTILSAADGVTAAATAIGAGAEPGTPFVWYPAMFLAAKDQTTWLASASGLETDHDASTLASRAKKYGTAGSALVEGLYRGVNSAKNTVARLLIDDNDATALKFQGAFTVVDNTQAAVSCAAHATAAPAEQVCTALLGAGFVAGSAYEACSAPAVAAAAVVPTGALALTTALATASALLVLF